MFKRYFLIFNTLRYLKLSQITGRVRRKFCKVKVDLWSTPQLFSSTGDWVEVARRSQRMLNVNQFQFLNVVSYLATSVDWNSSTQTKLWLYNLHYFDDLNSFDSDKRSNWHRELIQQWIDENPPGSCNGWEPYPISLRIVNWIKWGLSGHSLDDAWNHSLAVQVRYLSKQLEFHLLGNHLFANAKALVFAGLYFEGEEADRWLKMGFSILERQVPEQILPDGGQFELSPMYHAIALEDMLDLCNICSAFSARISEPWQDLVASFKHVSSKMLHWMMVMNHPDDKLSFFNDSTIDIAADSAELIAYAERLSILPLVNYESYTEVVSQNSAIQISSPLPSSNGEGKENQVLPWKNYIYLEDSGYIRVQKDNVFAFLDVARIGPDYLPGHAHADTLSFEFSWYGQRVLVNSGTSCYGVDNERLRQRGTAAHNTVVINGENSSEVWSGFRVARRAKPFNYFMNDTAEGLIIGCSHDGYLRLKGKPIHHRQWLFKPNEFVVEDTITGPYRTAEARFHFHPDVKLITADSAVQGVISVNKSLQLHWEVVFGVAALEASSYHPEFGLSIENFCLVVRFQSQQTVVRFYWSH